MENSKIETNKKYIDTIAHFKEETLNNIAFKDIVSILEKTIQNIVDIQEICIISINNQNEQLTYITDNITLPIVNDGGSIVLESFYKQTDAIISHARRHSLYRQKFDNPNNIKAESIIVIPKVINSQITLLLKIISTKKNWNIDSNTINFLHKIFSLLKYKDYKKKVTTSPLIKKYNNIILDIRSITILAIDNSSIILRLIKRSLQGYNVNVLTTSNNIKGISIFENNRIDLIFIDEAMNGLWGHEAISKIRSIEKKSQAKPVPIIALLTDDTPETKALLIDAGVTEIIYKPIVPKTVHTLMKRYIKTYHNLSKPKFKFSTTKTTYK